MESTEAVGPDLYCIFRTRDRLRHSLSRERSVLECCAAANGRLRIVSPSINICLGFESIAMLARHFSHNRL